MEETLDHFISNDLKPVYVASDTIISPLGYSSEENFNAVIKGMSGIREIDDSRLSSTTIYAGKIDDALTAGDTTNTRFEKLAIASASAALQRIRIDPASSRVLFILSTTKGNIDLLHDAETTDPRLFLSSSAHCISKTFKNPVTPLVVSNACISGVMALIIARRLLEQGRYDHAVVIGADSLSKFVISGFQSLQAISPTLCKPFDKDRQGINLGEAFATMVLTVDPAIANYPSAIRVLGGGLSNDANHISGPSRTGEELAAAVRQALQASGKKPEDIDFISAHGTATLYNDEMEAKAFNLVGMQKTPLNSLKGYFGHTLGAAGIVEAALSVRSLLANQLVPTKGFSNPGVSQPLNVIHEVVEKQLRYCLKTASGFGGCNAALVFEKLV